MDEEKTTKHESFGIIRLSRVSGKRTLFGSSIEHHHWLEISIKKADLRRSLHTDWIVGKEDLIRVALSETQLTEMLMNLNQFEGAPCTLERISDGELHAVADCPATSNQAQYVEEFKEDLREITANLERLATQAVIYAEGAPNKGERREFQKQLSLSIQKIQSDLPFILSQFNEKVEKVVGTAKNEVQTYVNEVIRTTGLNGLKQLQLGGPFEKEGQERSTIASDSGGNEANP